MKRGGNEKRAPVPTPYFNPHPMKLPCLCLLLLLLEIIYQLNNFLKRN